MKLLGVGTLGGLGVLYITDLATRGPFKKMVVTGLTGNTKKFSKYKFSSKILPFDFDPFGMINSFFPYFPSLKPLLLERLPDERLR